MRSVTTRGACLAIGAIILSTTLALPTDHVISIPQEWVVDSGNVPYDASTDSFAVVAYKYKTPDPRSIFDRSIIIQQRPSGENYTTEFAGKVYAVKYSPDGSHLLAHQMSSGVRQVHLLTSQGQIVWSKSDGRTFEFSTTGAVVYAWDTGGVVGVVGGGGTTIEIFDLTGAATQQVTFDEPLRGVFVLGSGEQVVLVVRRSILCLDSGAAPANTAWRIDLPSEYPSIVTSRLLDSERFVARLQQAVSIVVNLDGTLEYTYDPQALGDNDVLLDEHKYANYRMFPGPSAGTITLFDRTSGTFTLNPVSGELTPRSISTILPSTGFTLGDWVLQQHLFFFAPSEVRVRPLN